MLGDLLRPDVTVVLSRGRGISQCQHQDPHHRDQHARPVDGRQDRARDPGAGEHRDRDQSQPRVGSRAPPAAALQVRPLAFVDGLPILPVLRLYVVRLCT